MEIVSVYVLILYLAKLLFIILYYFLLIVFWFGESCWFVRWDGRIFYAYKKIYHGYWLTCKNLDSIWQNWTGVFHWCSTLFIFGKTISKKKFDFQFSAIRTWFLFYKLKDVSFYLCIWLFVHIGKFWASNLWKTRYSCLWKLFIFFTCLFIFAL